MPTLLETVRNKLSTKAGEVDVVFPALRCLSITAINMRTNAALETLNFPPQLRTAIAAAIQPSYYKQEHPEAQDHWQSMIYKKISKFGLTEEETATTTTIAEAIVIQNRKPSTLEEIQAAYGTEAVRVIAQLTGIPAPVSEKEAIRQAFKDSFAQVMREPDPQFLISSNNTRVVFDGNSGDPVYRKSNQGIRGKMLARKLTEVDYTKRKVKIDKVTLGNPTYDIDHILGFAKYQLASHQKNNPNLPDEIPGLVLDLLSGNTLSRSDLENKGYDVEAITRIARTIRHDYVLKMRYGNLNSRAS